MIRSLLVFLLAASPFAAGCARAATVVIWPVDPVIRPGEQATSLWLENTGSTPVTLQVRSFAWSQADGSDTLAAQDAIVASPPIATVAPGRRQLVRIIRRDPAATAAPEASYRLIIDELPTPPATGEARQLNASLAVQMRYSIPLFAYAADPAGLGPRLVTSPVAGGGGREIEIEIHNAGAGHARLTDLRLVADGREQIVRPGLAGYVLPGARVRVPLPGNAAGVMKAGVNGRDDLLTPGT